MSTDKESPPQQGEIVVEKRDQPHTQQQQQQQQQPPGRRKSSTGGGGFPPAKGQHPALGSGHPATGGGGGGGVGGGGVAVIGSRDSASEAPKNFWNKKKALCPLPSTAMPQMQQQQAPVMYVPMFVPQQQNYMMVAPTGVEGQMMPPNGTAYPAFPLPYPLNLNLTGITNVCGFTGGEVPPHYQPPPYSNKGNKRESTPKESPTDN